MLLTRTERLNEKKEPHALLVYTGGHGVTDQDEQVHLLNSTKPDEVLFDIERKLKSLIINSGDSSQLKVFAIYDSDRLNLNKIEGLKFLQTIQASDERQQNIDYAHIHACATNGIAKTDGKFCEKIFTSALKCTKKSVYHVITFPTDWTTISWRPG